MPMAVLVGDTAEWHLFPFHSCKKKMKRFNRNNCLLKRYRHKCPNRHFYGYLWQSKPIFKAKLLRFPHPLTYKYKL